MLIRNLIGTTAVGLAAAALLIGPNLPATASPEVLVREGAAPSDEAAVLHDCPATANSECLAVFLPDLTNSDNGGAAHSTHAPELRICGPLDSEVSWQAVSSCDEAGTGSVVKDFPFSCGDITECVEIPADYYQGDWHTCGGEGEEDDDDDSDDDDSDDDDDLEGDCDTDDDDDDDDGDEDGGTAVSNGFYLAEVLVGGTDHAGGIVFELGDSEVSGTPHQFENGTVISFRFRLADKIIG